MDLQEIRCENANWIHMVQSREEWWAFVNAGMNLRVPNNVGNFLIS